MYEVAQCGRFIVNICILAFLRLGIQIRRGELDPYWEKHLSCLCDPITASSPDCELWVHVGVYTAGETRS